MTTWCSSTAASQDDDARARRGAAPPLLEWTVTQESFAKARDMTPKDDVARFYKLVFVRTPPATAAPTARTRAATSARRPTPKYLKAAERTEGT